ncbi:MAG TPA: IPT/TIG domain-containing protein [Thermoanaerobaculia bacterium]|nr:IPT/TIG domain-containing protein [Thermoanaerobaculia bacterium]
MSARSFAVVVLAVIASITAPAFAATTTAFVPASAPHGARAVVAGTGLDQGVLAITFPVSGGGIAAAPIVSRSASLVEIAVPPQAVSGALQVTANGTPIGTFSFTLLPDPPFAKVTTLAASDQAHDIFKGPSGVAVIPSTGAVIVADRLHHQIKAVSPDGQVTVLAGSGKPGLADGAGAQATFKEPGGVAVDDVRKLIYVADSGNNVIRRITYDGTVSTFAGSGREDDFKRPAGLAVDSAGNVYVADTGNSRIRVISPQGVVTTIAGGGHEGLADGPALQALFKQPAGVAVDASGTVFVADTMNNVIRKIANGLVVTVAGTGHGGYADGAGSLAELKAPSGISVDDAGTLYVADVQNNLIRRITSSGIVSTLAGISKSGFADGDPAAAQFNQPAGIAFASAIYVADAGNDALRVIVPMLHAAAVYPNVGPIAGGNQVRIFGSGFLPGVTQVSFGSAPATAITFITATELLVNAPSGSAGAVDVKITTPAATDVLVASYTYLPPPAIASVSPLKGKTAGGAVITITGSNFAADATAVTIGGIAAANVSVVSSTSLTCAVPPAPAGPADIVVSTPGGSVTRTAAFTYFAPPVITSFAPAQGSAGTTVTISGQNFDADAGGDQVSFGGLAAQILSAATAQLVAVAPPGVGDGKITVTTAGGTATSTADYTVASLVRLQIATPTTTLDLGQTVQFSAIGILQNGTGTDVSSRASWSSNDASVSVSPAGAVTAGATGSATILATLNGFSASIRVTVVSIAVPPDPATVAPAVNQTVPISFRDAYAFLYSGSSPIQIGVAPGTIDAARAGVIRGTVRTSDGAPLRAVQLSVVGHAEYGSTLSRADGRFDLAVNGGGLLTLRYERNGFLPAERTVDVSWHDFAIADDVVLLPLDNAVTAINAAAPAVQVARGMTSFDSDGARTATLLFAANTGDDAPDERHDAAALDDERARHRVHRRKERTSGHAGGAAALHGIHLLRRPERRRSAGRGRDERHVLQTGGLLRRELPPLPCRYGRSARLLRPGQLAMEGGEERCGAQGARYGGRHGHGGYRRRWSGRRRRTIGSDRNRRRGTAATRRVVHGRSDALARPDRSLHPVGL